MGSHFKRAIFNDHVQVGIVGWAEKVKKKKALKADGQPSQGSSHTHEGSTGIQLGSVFQKKASAPEDNTSVTKPEGSN
jgi:mlo protein